MKLFLIFVFSIWPTFIQALDIPIGKIGRKSEVFIRLSLGNAEVVITEFPAALDFLLKRQKDLVSRCTVNFFWKNAEKVRVGENDTLEVVGRGKLDIDICGDKFSIKCKGWKCRKVTRHGKIGDGFTVRSVKVSVSTKIEIVEGNLVLTTRVRDVASFGDYLEEKLDLGKPYGVVVPEEKLDARKIKRVNSLSLEGRSLIVDIDRF